eukprot:CAMPEP_0185730032 /NCGR_PEP_ID=MMETSP1171-20130828/8165_1 /TAXON_ID=374046 /ORGANISM="Helicotheca tamensis, Strain CCMP826" /LENGTH=184 /DNA_ID=CAMNT_0028399005 /DNA_START=93 /DNA_END=647 /DNA_ORIENTATION=+
MGLWGQLIWVFFPIPILSLFLLSVPYPPALEKLGANIVHRIFFTRINIGPLRIQLLWFFFLTSAIIFANAVNVLQQEHACKTCTYPEEITWYKRAMKFRKERNFWLSLFNVALWYLVFVVYNLKKKILKLQEQIKEIKVMHSSVLEQVASAGDAKKEETEVKKDFAETETTENVEEEKESKKDK